MKTITTTVTKTIPEVGDIIYVPTQLFLSHGVDDFEGGKATVVYAEPSKHYTLADGTPRLEIKIKERPGHGYFWDILEPEQDKLKERFGDRWSYPDPDTHPDANRWD